MTNPDDNLREQLHLADWLSQYQYSTDPNAIHLRLQYTARLCNLITELNAHIMNKGTLPQAWQDC